MWRSLSPDIRTAAKMNLNGNRGKMIVTEEVSINVGFLCLQQLLTNYQHFLSPETPGSYSKQNTMASKIVLAVTSFQF
jgi:hypothetical protein